MNIPQLVVIPLMLVAFTAVACDAKTGDSTPPNPVNSTPPPSGPTVATSLASEEPECVAETADVPTALWSDAVLIRMPRGVEMVERNEVLAQATGEAESTCEAIVTRAVMGYFQDDGGKAITQLRDETLTQLGFDVATLTWSEERDGGRDFSCAYEAPADDTGNPPVKGWFQFKEHDGSLFWLIFEAHPNAFPAIAPSFKKSAASLVFTR